MKEKKCSRCKNKKSVDEFHKNKSTKDGYHQYCKECNSNDKKKRYQVDEGYRTRAKTNQIRVKYGLSPEDIELKLIKQNNRCAICGEEFKSKRHVFIDHNHETGKVRDLLCPKCNGGLGDFNDCVKMLRKAINYLEKFEK